jgi:hypothetical protein
MQAMTETLARLRAGEEHTAGLMPFGEMKERLGFDAYMATAARYDRD